MLTRRSMFGLVVFVAILSVASAANAELKVTAFRQGDLHYAEISMNIEGGTNVRMIKDGDAEWTTFDRWDDEFDIESDEFGSLAGLNNEIVGAYTIEITHSGGISEYAFTVQTVQSEWFPQNPVLSLVPDQIPQQYEFSWTWDGTAEGKCVEYSLWSPTGTVDFEQEYGPGDPGFNEKSLVADFGEYVGTGEFFSMYGNTTDSLVTNWALQSGPDVFGGLNPTQYIISEAMAEFEVVPEPTTMSLLALGALAMLRRRLAA